MNTVLEFWFGFQLIFDLFVLMLIFYIWTRWKSEIIKSASTQLARKITNIIEPVLKETKTTAEQFEKQLQEQRNTIQQFNEHMDSRITSLNLLLNRADSYLSRKETTFQPEHTVDNTIDVQQQAIMKLHEQGFSPEAIADTLSMNKGEVELVLEFKQKIIHMQKEHSDHKGSD